MTSLLSPGTEPSAHELHMWKLYVAGAGIKNKLDIWQFRLWKHLRFLDATLLRRSRNPCLTLEDRYSNLCTLKDKKDLDLYAAAQQGFVVYSCVEIQCEFCLKIVDFNQENTFRHETTCALRKKLDVFERELGIGYFARGIPRILPNRGDWRRAFSAGGMNFQN